MTLTDLITAHEFLQRICARGDDEERLVRTVQALEKEIERRHNVKR